MTTILNREDETPFGLGPSCFIGFLFGPVAAGIIADANWVRLGHPRQATFALRGLIIMVGLFLLSLVPTLELSAIVLYPIACWLFVLWINDTQRPVYNRWHHDHPEAVTSSLKTWLELLLIGLFWLIVTGGVWLVARYLLDAII